MFQTYRRTDPATNGSGKLDFRLDLLYKGFHSLDLLE